MPKNPPLDTDTPIMYNNSCVMNKLTKRAALIFVLLATLIVCPMCLPLYGSATLLQRASNIEEMDINNIDGFLPQQWGFMNSTITSVRSFAAPLLQTGLALQHRLISPEPFAHSAIAAFATQFATFGLACSNNLTLRC